MMCSNYQRRFVPVVATACFSSLTWILAVLVFYRPAAAQVVRDSTGHWIMHDGRACVLVGDSGTQCVMQNLNLDYRRWLDDCSAAGVNAVHIWLLVAPRQTLDGRVVEPRYGYVYPGITPWARRDDGKATALDGGPQWDLLAFDEGDDPQRHYWPRLRDLCSQARRRHLLLGMTVFFGWPKHNPTDWSYHPFNVINGGHLTESRPHVEVVQQIDQPGTEVLERVWSACWPAARKTQWLWERFADKLIRETQPYGNVFYVFMDERSYSDGNCADHFARFFRKRGAFWIDNEPRRAAVDGVIDGCGPGRNINRIAATAFAKSPPRPFFEFELPPYVGKEMRRNVYGCLLAGGHYFFHNDERQETVTTGIMTYDPHVRNSHREAVTTRQRWLGIASHILNEDVQDLREMAPHNELVRPVDAYCLANPGVSYVVYLPNGGTAEVHGVGADREYDVVRIDPGTGTRQRLTGRRQQNTLHFAVPSGSDWVVIIR